VFEMCVALTQHGYKVSDMQSRVAIRTLREENYNAPELTVTF
jgi:hypothetical protein